MTRLTILLCGLGLLTACGTEETTSTSTTTSSFMPQEGWWTVGAPTVIEDDCGGSQQHECSELIVDIPIQGGVGESWQGP